MADCRRYCGKECNQYHGDGTSQFSDCIDSHISCSCSSASSSASSSHDAATTTFTNISVGIIVIIVIVCVAVVGGIIACIVCAVMHSRRRNVNQPYAQANNNNYNNNQPPPPAYTPYESPPPPPQMSPPNPAQSSYAGTQYPTQA